MCIVVRMKRVDRGTSLIGLMFVLGALGCGSSGDCGNGTTVNADDSLDECLGPTGLGGDCAGATAGDYENCALDTTCDEPQPDSC